MYYLFHKLEFQLFATLETIQRHSGRVRRAQRRPDANVFGGILPRGTLVAAVLSVGSFTGMAAAQDRTVRAWGDNGVHQLGGLQCQGVNFRPVGCYSGTPIQVPTLTNTRAVAGGGSFSAALRSDGTVWFWGNGFPGNGTLQETRDPVQASISAVSAIAAGNSHILALKEDGSVWAWGGNHQNQLGNSNLSCRFNQISNEHEGCASAVPVQVSGLSGVVSIAAGELSSYAVKSDGTVWAWGMNDAFQLGSSAALQICPGRSGINGPCTNTPLAVPGLPATKIVVSGPGSMHALAITNAGVVHGWGLNDNSQLGSVLGQPCAWGSCVPLATSIPDAPIAVGGATGLFHSLLVGSDGSVWSWGRNNDGQLGTGNPPQTPGQVISGGAKTVTAGHSSSAVLKQDGSVYVWGSQVGGPSDRIFAPTLMRGLDPAVLAIGAGGFHMLAVVGVLDSTPPEITPQIMGTIGANGWYRSNVSVSWSVTDAESSISSQNGCASTTIATDTSSTGITISCIAASAGGTATKSVSIKRDATSPTLNPIVSAVSFVGAQITASANGQDASSGVASQSCDTPDTATVGLKSVLCTATDNAGNQASASAQYRVTYKINHLYSRTEAGPPAVAVQIANASGANLSSSSIPVSALCIAPAGATSCSAAVQNLGGEPFSFAGSGPAAQQGSAYLYRISTKDLVKGRTYSLVFSALNDPVSHAVPFTP